ncbi:MAG: hypothetical protein Q9188_005629 [Gyalolechia gomerana]
MEGSPSKLHQWHSTNLAHLKNTTTTPSPTSSNIAAWIDQLPKPEHLRSKPQLLTPIALKSHHLRPARPSRTRLPPHLLAKGPVKREGLRNLRSNRSSHSWASHQRKAPVGQVQLQRSARKIPTRHKVSTTSQLSERSLISFKMNNKRSSEKAGQPSPQKHAGENESDDAVDEAPEVHPMTTRGRKKAMDGPRTPDRAMASLNLADIPNLSYATPTRKSSSPAAKSASKKRSSPARSPTRSPSRLHSGGTTSSFKIVKREQLAQMTPAILFLPLECLKTDPMIPKSVTELWNDYLMPAIYDDEVVPQELKARLEAQWSTPMKTKGQIRAYDYGSKLYHPHEMPMVLETVESAVKQTRQYRGKTHEPHWVCEIVTPLLSRLRLLSCFSANGNEQLETLNISLMPISPHELCPTSPSAVFWDADFKVDHALALRLSEEQYRILSAGQYQVNGPASINQTTGWTCLKPMFAYVEIKLDARDPLVQLGPFLAAEFEKRYIEGYPMDIAVPAITVYEEAWKLWIVCSVSQTNHKPGHKPYRVQFLGPVNMGSTADVVGAFRILHILKAIAKWGLEVYNPAFLKNVLAKYE